jgi:hypothetical protein
MTNRHQRRRSDLPSFKREVSHASLLTYMVAA